VMIVRNPVIAPRIEIGTMIASDVGTRTKIAATKTARTAKIDIGIGTDVIATASGKRTEIVRVIGTVTESATQNTAAGINRPTLGLLPTTRIPSLPLALAMTIRRPTLWVEPKVQARILTLSNVKLAIANVCSKKRNASQAWRVGNGIVVTMLMIRAHAKDAGPDLLFQLVEVRSSTAAMRKRECEGSRQREKAIDGVRNPSVHWGNPPKYGEDEGTFYYSSLFPHLPFYFTADFVTLRDGRKFSFFIIIRCWRLMHTIRYHVRVTKKTKGKRRLHLICWVHT
jgi:hypothetical protein